MTRRKPEGRGLGRGLSALIGDLEDTQAEAGGRAGRVVPVDKVFPNPDQPRRRFAEDALEELAASIREKGIIQPLIVRPRPGKPQEYEIVAGERRWRAAQRAQLHEVPVIERDLADSEVLELAIVENIQRADLDPIDEAAGYRQLIDRFGHTQEALAAALGKSRSHIANCMRLLALPDEVQEFLRNGQLSAGHARALIPLENPSDLARDVIRRGLSVRETERLAQAAQGPKAPRRSASANPASAKDADTRALENDLAATLRMRVSIDHAAGQPGGRLSIQYRSLDDLDALCAALARVDQAREGW